MHLEIISPDKIAFSGKVKQVTIKGADGELTILTGHTALFAQVVEGELKFIDDQGEQFMAIGGGIIEVLNNKVSILVTRAIHQDELDEREIQKAKEKAEKILSEKRSVQEYKAARALLHSHLIDLKVLRRRKKRAASLAPV